MAAFSSYKNILMSFDLFALLNLFYVPQGGFLKTNRICNFSWAFKKVNRHWLSDCYGNFR